MVHHFFTVIIVIQIVFFWVPIQTLATANILIAGYKYWDLRVYVHLYKNVEL